jgi:hypothetical protein
LPDPRDILAAIKVVRARFSFTSTADVNSKKAKEIGDARRQVFGGDYNPQGLRRDCISRLRSKRTESTPLGTG